VIRQLGRWLFGIPGVRKGALILLYPFPSLRRLLRIFVGVEGGLGIAADHIDHSAPELLAPRARAIFADLQPVKPGVRKASP
jgi:hypothetical protein